MLLWSQPLGVPKKVKVMEVMGEERDHQSPSDALATIQEGRSKSRRPIEIIRKRQE
jgi:hypothetical protein